MREIKFRAWEKDKMIQWEDFDRLLKNPSVIPTKLFEGHDIIKLMQYTGLKDKNGIEVYEGDILGEENDDSVKDVVKFGYMKKVNDSWGIAYCSTGFYIEYPDKTTNLIHDLEDTYGCRTSEHIVIGNIYENPELLTQK